MTLVHLEYLTLQPGDLVLDYATWRPPSAQFLRDLGVKAVVRYQAAKTLIPTKLLEDPETKWLHDNGFGVLVCHESYATRAASGYNGGIADGQFMQAWADDKKYPAECGIIFADDTNETAPTLPTAGQYQLGADVVNTRGTGPYGDNDIMQWCVDMGVATGILWYAGAVSWSGGKPPIAECHVQQTIKGSVGGKYDMNVVLRPLNVWLPHDVEVPPKKEIPVTPYVFKLASGAYGIRHESGSRHLNDGELTGPFKNEPVYDVPAGSNWESWINDELGKYVDDLHPVPLAVEFPPVTFPAMHVALDIGDKGHISGSIG